MYSYIINEENFEKIIERISLTGLFYIILQYVYYYIYSLELNLIYKKQIIQYLFYLIILDNMIFVLFLDLKQTNNSSGIYFYKFLIVLY